MKKNDSIIFKTFWIKTVFWFILVWLILCSRLFSLQCDRAGWYVGMLPDGTTGLYPGDHFQPSPVAAVQSDA